MILRICPQPSDGGHVRVRFASAPALDRTFAGLGELVMTPAEWHAWRNFYRATSQSMLAVQGAYSERSDGTITIKLPETVTRS
jgi:hypothetical protein